MWSWPSKYLPESLTLFQTAGMKIIVKLWLFLWWVVTGPGCPQLHAVRLCGSWKRCVANQLVVMDVKYWLLRVSKENWLIFVSFDKTWFIATLLSFGYTFWKVWGLFAFSDSLVYITPSASWIRDSWSGGSSGASLSLHSFDEATCLFFFFFFWNDKLCSSVVSWS